MNDERQPWWTVTAVFDPDDGGGDFGYTEGLATAGVPELHLWARPSLGEDAGLDWKLSQRDTCQLLNHLAWRLLDGKLAVGDTWVETYDEGLSEARFSVHEPVTAAEVDAFGAGDSPVLPIKWELRRPALGEPRSMEPEAEADAAAAYDELAPRRAREPAPPGWELAAVPSWDPEQRFGPRTPLVLGRAAQLWSASVDDWIRIAEHVLVAHDCVPIGYALAVSSVAARGPGRAGAVARLEAAAGELMTGFGRHWGVPHLAAVRAWFGEGLEPGPEVDHGWRNLLEEITFTVTCHLVVEAVADVLPARVPLLGQGVVLGALSPPGLAPDARWLCSPTVDRAVRELVARTPIPALVEAAAAWDRVFWDEPGLPLVVASWTSAGHSRPAFELLDPASCVAAHSALRSRGHDLGALQVWLTSLATVLTARAALDPGIVGLFLEAGRRVAGLERLVHSPLATEAA